MVNKNVLRFIFVIGVSAAGFAEEPECGRFSASVLDNALPGAYQIAAADINRDGKIDIAALGEGEKESGVYWYENPSWKRRPICEKALSHLIDLAFHDIDGDGELEAALASSFNLNDPQTSGVISWLDRQQDLDQPWTVYPIAKEFSAHRLRWADRNGDGRWELIVAPIIGAGSTGPDYSQTPARLLAFAVPADPRKEEWRGEVIDQSLHLSHGLDIQRVQGKDVILLAGLEGLTMFSGKGEKQVKQSIMPGAQTPGKLSGCGEIAVGKRPGGELFLASIDPWHGAQVAVYSPFTFTLDKASQREVIDDSYNAGHAVGCADFDQDGGDEIIAGYRGDGYTIYYYDCGADRKWRRSAIARDVAAQGFAIADYNGDGWLDFAATGGQTNNVKLYMNRGEKSKD